MNKWLAAGILMITAHLCAGEKIENRMAALSDSLLFQFPDSIAAPRLAVLPFTDKTGKEHERYHLGDIDGKNDERDDIRDVDRFADHRRPTDRDAVWRYAGRRSATDGEDQRAVLLV